MELVGGTPLRKLVRTNRYQPYLGISQRSPLWESARKNTEDGRSRLGASNFAAAANVWGAYESRASLWDKMTGRKDTVPNAFMLRGSQLEPMAAACFAGNFGGTLHRVGMVISDSDSRKACSPDGIWEEPVGLPITRSLWPEEEDPDGRWCLEIKCPTLKRYVDVPPHHQAQILGQMEICGIPKCLYFVYYAEDDFDVWAVRHASEKWDLLEKRIDLFLEFLEKKIRPPIAAKGSKWDPDLRRIKFEL